MSVIDPLLGGGGLDRINLFSVKEMIIFLFFFKIFVSNNYCVAFEKYKAFISLV